MEFKIFISKEAQSDLENAYQENVNKKVATEFLKIFGKLSQPTAKIHILKSGMMIFRVN
jgi:hypothetical protein